MHEALTASLNKYGNVDMAYMESLTDKSQSDLLEELRGRIFYNPLSKNYEIADRFISGNVMAKAEHIEEYLQSHPDNGEARISLEALRQSLPTPIPFEDLDFNFGERWIPAGVYSRYASWLFDTDVSVRYTASNDEYSIKADMTSPTHHEPIFGAFGKPHLQRHPPLCAMPSTTPRPTSPRPYWTRRARK